MPDEHYYQLSGFFRSEKLYIYVQHLCQSIIFSLLGDYVSGQNYNYKTHHETEQSNIRENLKCLVDAKLYESLFNGKQLALETDTSTVDCYKPDSAKSRRILAVFLFKQLSAELTKVIDHMAKQLKLFIDVYKVQVQVQGYLTNATITATFKLPSDTDENSQVDTHAKNPSTIAISKYFVLKLLVPDKNFLSNCLIDSNELFAGQLISNEPRIKLAEILVGQTSVSNNSYRILTNPIGHRVK